MSQPKFTDLNPFKNSLETIRFVSNVDKQIYNFFYAIFPTNGLQQTTINLIFSKLHIKCVELGITPGTVDSDKRFQEFITGFRFELSGSTGGSPHVPAEASNDGRATSNSSPTSETATNSRPKLPRTAGKRKQPSRGKKSVAKQSE